jgi:hypothetical protein
MNRNWLFDSTALFSGVGMVAYTVAVRGQDLVSSDFWRGLFLLQKGKLRIYAEEASLQG